MKKMMRKRILPIISIIALLIYPLSVSAQSSFSLSLDIDSAAGDQAITSLNTSADQVIAIQIFGTNIQNANALAVRFEYDTAQVTYDGFEVGSVLPSAQALPEHGTNPTFVEIGIASLGGQATANSGLVGTIRFRATAAFSGTAIRLVRAELSRGGRFETITPNLRVELQTPPAPTNFSLSLDVDSATGDQSVTSLNTSADQVIAIQIFGTDIQNANGVSMRFEYDTSQVTYDGFDAGNVLPNAQALPEHGTNPTFVQIGIVSFGSQATVNSGLIGTIRFRTTGTFSGTTIRLARAELSRSGQFETITPNIQIALQVATAPSPDFDGNGIVNIADFLAFVSQFGNRQGDGKYDAKYDLDSDGEIGISDFLSFVNDFGKEVSSSGGGGGSGGSGGSGSPDLIVEWLTVSDSTLTAGQSFTLQATVRNQGSGQAAATTLRYYQSSDATITVNDTQVGTDAIGSLNASGTSAKSISLNAPSRAGTYYYGACVEQVSGEPEIDNNCSRAVRVSVSGGSGLVDIPDANLRAVIADSLGKARNAPITPAEMATLTSLDAQDMGIRDLTGLEFATNLKDLDLGTEWVAFREVREKLEGYVDWRQSGANSNAISNLLPLSGLYRLTSLNLGNNVISDVSALSGLTELTSLDIYGNAISDVSALSGLTELTSLDLYNNVISDVSALSNLTKLEKVFLGKNFISDVSALANLTSLETLNLEENTISDVAVLSVLTKLADLNLSNNAISDISALATLTNLTWLSLSSNAISGVSALANLTRLERMFAIDNAISDLSPLSNLTNLTDLALGANVISDVSALANLNRLERLGLSTNIIPDIIPLRNLTKLEGLALNINTISDITPLSNLTKLTRLQIWGNNISDVSPLGGLINLESLYLHGNPVSDVSALRVLNNLRFIGLNGTAIMDVSALVSALSGLPQLTGIFLGDNAISDISALSRMTNLSELLLSYNSISDITALSVLTDLKWLYLDNNTIVDISPLVANTGLGSGDEVDVRYNPLSDTSLNTHIPTLQGRGVIVQFGSSKPAIGEKETRMPSMPVMKENERRIMPRAMMESFGVGAREEAEHMSRMWMEMGEDVISQTARRKIRNTTKADERDRRRMEMRQDMISRKASLRDKARREAQQLKGHRERK